MDFNILIPSISQTLGMPSGTQEQIQLLGRRLMNLLSEDKHRRAAIAKLEIMHKELLDKFEQQTEEKALAESALIDLAQGDKLSNLVKDKNKAVIESHKISIVGKSVKYPISSPKLSKFLERPQ